MLSSTINTLIGGTAPFSMPAGNEGWSELVFLFFLGRLAGRGDDIRGGGTACGICERPFCCGVGGEGRGGATGAALDMDLSGRLEVSSIIHDSIKRHEHTRMLGGDRGLAADRSWRGRMLATQPGPVPVMRSPASPRRGQARNVTSSQDGHRVRG